MADLAGAAQQSLLGYGVVGLAALVFGWFSWTSLQRERRRSDELEARLNALQDSIRTEYVPAMTRVTDVMARLLDLLPELSSPPRRRS